MKAIFEDSDDAGPLSGLIKINSEESDPDFDDVEVDLSQLRKPASGASSASAVDNSNKALAEKYGFAIALGNILDIKTLHTKQVKVNEAAENLKNSPTPENNKKYKEALLDMLNLRSWLIHSAHSQFVIPGDAKQDSMLEADPLLSVAELKLLNASITPKHPLRGPVPRKSFNRQSIPNWSEAIEEAKAIDEQAKANPITGIPDNWQTGSVEKMMLDAKTLVRSTLIDMGGLTDLVAEVAAYNRVQTFFGRGTVVLNDSSGRYSGNFIVNGRGGKRLATDAQVKASLEAVLSSGNVIDMPGTQSARGKYGSENRGFDVLITTTQYEYPESKTTSAEQGVQAYANPVRGVTILADRLNRTQETVDSGLAKDIDGGPNSLWSTKIDKNTQDAITHGVIHEIGHMIAFRSGLSKTEMRGDGQAPSRYGRESEHENFAEYYAKYIRTGDAPDWFMKILRQRNLLKSQRNN